MITNIYIHRLVNFLRKEVESVKKILKKTMKSSLNAIRYFSGELVKYRKEEHFEDGSSGDCWYVCTD